MIKEKKPKKSLKDMFRAHLEKKRGKKIKRKLNLKIEFEKAGLPITSGQVTKVFFAIAFLINIYLTYLAFREYGDGIRHNILSAIFIFPVVWVNVTIISQFVLWLLFYMVMDFRTYQRTKKLEEVLPDFLQLASSNIRAGMTVDHALWFAIRPRFGVLAREIEEVAKRTYAGEALELALENLVKKYNSKMLERTVNLMVEGIRSGGEVGGLMNKISLNIQEQNIMKKEMAANVTTYVIFITFATIVAAPFLFALALNLVDVIQQVFSKINISPGASSGMPLQISDGVISTADFKRFALVSLMITSLFSAMIVSTIKKGNVKSGVKYIPIFMGVSIALFLIMVQVFNVFISGFF